MRAARRRRSRRWRRLRRAVEIKGVLHVARGVVGGDAQLLEIVEVPLDLGAIGDVEAEAREDLDDVVERLRDRMAVAAMAGAAGQRDVELFAMQIFFQLALRDALLRLLEERLELGDGIGDQLAHARAIGGGQRAHPLAQAGERAALAEVLHARRLDMLLVGGSRQLCSRLLEKCVDLLDHVNAPSKRLEPRRVSPRGSVSSMLQTN